MHRIALIGSGGSGKSTLARTLGARLGLPVHHLDALYWQPGWVATDRPRWRQMQEALCAQPRWIVDGHYGATLDIRLQHCDTVIFLDMNRWLCLARVLWRSLRGRGRRRVDMAPGCPERIDGPFMKLILQFPRDKRPGILAALQALPPSQTVHVLRNPRQVRDFVAVL